MARLQVNYDILNQKDTPAIYASSLASRPTFGFAGRVFIDTDNPSTGIYRDTGTSWVQVADETGTIPTPTLETVTTAGSSTTIGISTSGKGIGIGTTIPASNRLDIHSATGLQATFNGTGVTNAAIQLQLAGVGKWTLQNNYNTAANDFVITDVLNTINRLTITNTGTASLIANLTATSFIKSGGTSAQILAADGSVITAGTNISISGGTISTSGVTTGSGTSGQITYFNGTTSVTGSATLTFTPTTELLLNNSVTAAAAIARGINSTSTLTASANSDVLVGLEVNPTFTAGAFTNVKKIGLRLANLICIWNGANAALTTNLVVGNSSSLGSNTTSNWNTVFGYDALANNTTSGFNTVVGNSSFNSSNGGSNTGLGYQAGQQVTGSLNTAVGYIAMRAAGGTVSSTGIGHNCLTNLTGSNNTAVGSFTLGQGSGTGGNNTAIGFSALNTSTTSNNTAIGYQAGRYFGTGTSGNTTCNGSVYIGYDVRASANLQTNEIIIAGYNGTAGAVGNGSNTTTIGNSTTTTTNLLGRVNTNGVTDNSAFGLNASGKNVNFGGLAIEGLTFTTSTTATKNYVLYVFNGAAGQTLTLPASVGSGNFFLIKNITANSLNINFTGADTYTSLVGTTPTSYTLFANQVFYVVSNGISTYIQII